MDDVWHWLGVYAVSISGGFLVDYWIKFLRRDIADRYKDAPNQPKDPSIASLDWSIGTIERFVATTLTIFAPTLLAPFVGGWVALKFAANWQARKQGDEGLLAKHRLVALIGSALSFGWAIGVGILANPESALAWKQ